MGNDFRVSFSPMISGRSRYLVTGRRGGKIKCLNEFLDAAALRGLSERTLRTYAYALLSVWKWLKQSSRHIEALTELDLADYILHVHQEAREKIPPAPRSINLRLVVLRSLYLFQTDRELPRAPKAPHMAMPVFVHASRVGMHASRRFGRTSFSVKVPRRLVVPLTRQEVRRFFERLRPYRDLALVALMLFCGLRSREVLCLELNDLSLIQEQIRVSGKGDKDRVLPLAPYVRTAISAYLEIERPVSKETALFLNLKGPTRGKPMTPAGLRDLFRYHRKIADVQKANPHRFRHTFAVDMVREGMSLPVLKRLLGHSNIETTMRYVNLSAEDVRVEFERVVRRRSQRSPDENSLPGSP